LATFRRRRLVYGGRWPLAAIAAVLFVAGVVVAAMSGRGALAAVPAAVATAWLAYAVRIQARVPAGGGRGGPGPGSGAGVREPRRPLPKSPAGAAARPLV
jgi:hypothetical protein